VINCHTISEIWSREIRNQGTPTSLIPDQGDPFEFRNQTWQAKR